MRKVALRLSRKCRADFCEFSAARNRSGEQESRAFEPPTWGRASDWRRGRETAETALSEPSTFVPEDFRMISPEIQNFQREIGSALFREKHATQEQRVSFQQSVLSSAELDYLDIRPRESLVGSWWREGAL